GGGAGRRGGGGGGPGGAAGGGEGAGGEVGCAAAGAPRPRRLAAARTSLRVMRPPSPVPCTSPASSLYSLSSRRTTGDMSWPDGGVTGSRPRGGAAGAGAGPVASGGGGTGPRPRRGAPGAGAGPPGARGGGPPPPPAPPRPRAPGP